MMQSQKTNILTYFQTLTTDDLLMSSENYLA